MILILNSEEEIAEYQRKLCPDLPDNLVEDELLRLKFLETGKMIVACCGPQETRMMIRALRKMSPEEKREARENLRWDLYRKMPTDKIQ